MEAVTLGLLTLALCLAMWGWAVTMKSLRFWEARGVAHPKPWPIVGNWLPVLFNRIGQGDFYTRLYQAFPNDGLVGVYSFLRPVLVIKDPELTEKIFVKDFSHFTNRGIEFDVTASPIDDGLFLMKGDKWRAMRVKLSPAFTSGKLKTMFEEAVRCGESLVRLVQRAGQGDLEIKTLMSVYTSDVIGSCVFGVDLSSGLTPESEFVAKARRAFVTSPWRLFKFFLFNNVPSLRRFIGVSFTAPDVAEYFGGILRKTVETRRNNNVVRNDFLQLLFQLKDKGTIKSHKKDPDDDYLGIDQNEAVFEEEFTDNTLIAQAYTFLSAGFDPTSTALEYALFELSRNPEVQQKAREEIISVLEKEGSLTYQSLNNMSYLDKVFKETLRFYPAGSFLFRECNKEYTLDTGLTLKPGQFVVFPTLGFQTDPNYFPEPEKFKPERFDQEPVKGTFLPFGAGPRMCIGMRFAQINVKIGLVMILRNFNIEPSSRTKLPVQFNPRSFVNSPLNPLWCKLIKIN